MSSGECSTFGICRILPETALQTSAARSDTTEILAGNNSAQTQNTMENRLYSRPPGAAKLSIATTVVEACGPAYHGGVYARPHVAVVVVAVC